MESPVQPVPGMTNAPRVGTAAPASWPGLTAVTPVSGWYGCGWSIRLPAASLHACPGVGARRAQEGDQGRIAARARGWMDTLAGEMLRPIPSPGCPAGNLTGANPDSRKEPVSNTGFLGETLEMRPRTRGMIRSWPPTVPPFGSAIPCPQGVRGRRVQASPGAQRRVAGLSQRTPMPLPARNLYGIRPHRPRTRRTPVAMSATTGVLARPSVVVK